MFLGDFMIIRGKFYNVISEIEDLNTNERTVYNKDKHLKILKKSYVKALKENELIKVDDDTFYEEDFKCLVSFDEYLDIYEN